MLLTGMSGTGKSSLVHELRQRGCRAFDLDDDGLTGPGSDGRWHWWTSAVADLLAAGGGETVLVAGCSEEQAQFAWDLTILLTAPADVVADRLRTRTTNQYGRHPDELARVLADREQVEPLLRRSADLAVDTRRPVSPTRCWRRSARVLRTPEPRSG